MRSVSRGSAGLLAALVFVSLGTGQPVRTEGSVKTATPTERYGVTVIELQGTVVLPPTYGGANPQWEVIIEFDQNFNPPPAWWVQSPWRQPWTNANPLLQGWSCDLVNMSGGVPNVPIDWTEGYYWARPKFTCWSGGLSTSFYGDWFFFEVWYD